ncbi:hypothetical protein JD844_000726 [Phrynosoma platyrhinos]|uniref:Uncharacterized protein n=1 Tax=Phrynosoma platyrhinos TaxID=52577 RepID=A0ABQ7T9B1_PHRPL|nr:hypothetical protein JD844_000726 [Phrynosoma platyrhinos]
MSVASPPGVSVRSMVNAYESQREPQGCGCCTLPNSGDPRRPRQRGCTSPALSRDASPARPRPRESPQGPCRKLNGQKKEVDKTLVSLLLVLHSGTNSSMIAIDNKIEQAMVSQGRGQENGGDPLQVASVACGQLHT